MRLSGLPDEPLKLSAARRVWRRGGSHNIPVPDFAAPTVAQIEQFLALVSASVPEKKVLVHCRGGIGRTGTMAAAYWIAKGLSWQAAIAHTRERRRYAVENRQQEERLREFAASRGESRRPPP